MKRSSVTDSDIWYLTVYTKEESQEIFQNIRHNLKELRLKHKLTQNDVAELTGKAPTAVASWEQGKSLPDIATLYFLSEYYGVSMDYMCSAEACGTESYIDRISSIKAELELDKYYASQAQDREDIDDGIVIGLEMAIDTLKRYAKKDNTL